MHRPGLVRRRVGKNNLQVSLPRERFSHAVENWKPGTNLAAVSVLLLDDSGETTQAAAYSTLIMVFVVSVLIGFQTILRFAGFRNVQLIR